MALASGTKLGPYEILAALGAGGMGEVYRARDPRIGRDVAVKVLPPELSADTERLRRFEHEARAAGALNHPNILAIHDVGADHGIPYLVSELLEGETLAAKRGGSALPQRKAVEYALQIVHGLAAAHEKGIIHRDLKPANLFVTKDGHVKILDFGLAKQLPPATAAAELTREPTISRQTETGVVLGTIVYMSPEQVSGSPVDPRSDIFAVGTVLYEMLSGRRPFQGASTIELMSAILKEQPPELSELNPSVSPALESIVSRCLEKDPYERFQSARDLGFALEAIATGSGPSAAAATVVSERNRSRSRGYLAIAGVAAAAALVLGIGYFQLRTTRQRPVRAMINPPENLKFFTVFGGVALSPDGAWIAFTTDSEGDRLWVRRMDSGSVLLLPGTAKAYGPFWSPDSKALGFFTESKMKKIGVEGGPAQTICDAPYGRGGTWNRDGQILFTPNVKAGLFQVPATGGEPRPVTRLGPNETTHRWPCFLPDGRHFVYVARLADQKHASSVFVASLDSSEPRLLLANSGNAVYAPPGYLIFIREGALTAQRFDASRLQATADPFPLTSERVEDNLLGSVAPFSVSQTGLLAFRADLYPPNQLSWLTREGQPIGSAFASGWGDIEPRLSPTGNSVAIVRSNAQRQEPDIWIIDAADHKLTRLTFDSALKQTPVWSPDGNWIAYGSNRTGGTDLYQKASHGGGQEELLVHSSDLKSPDDWSRDGRFILYERKDPVTEFDLWILPLVGDRKPYLFLRTPYREQAGRFSPDGRWIAYQSDESGTFEIYVRPFPAGGNPSQVSHSGGVSPSWRSDGKELFFISRDHRLMSAEVKAAANFQSNPARALFQISEEWFSSVTAGYGWPGYDVAPGGQKFCFAAPAGARPAAPITLVLNWNANLR